ncbi:tetratricopeptide repeat protein [Streptomyces sp. 900105755]
MSSSDSPERISQQATASGQAQANQAGRDQKIDNSTTVWAAGAGPGPEAAAGLPAAVDLVGRENRTGELLDVLDPGGAGPTVAVVTGLAGVGKTALALHAAHRARTRGWFGGGTLFVHLRGYDSASSVSGTQALEVLLRAMGIRDTDLPPTAAEQESLYQSELDRRARELGPVLVVADDASVTAQLLPLLPAHSGNRLLATSRDMLTSPDLPARLISLDQLALQPATDLIASTLTRTRPDDPRPARDPEALQAVATHCGGLPLALTIAAAQLTADPGLPVADLAAGLADARTRLEALHYQDRDGRSLNVQAAFELSYRRLDKQPARMFRLLSLNPGPDIATETAAALADQLVGTARKDLAALASAGLISEQPVGSGRWRMHDLTRLYADDLGRRHDHDPREQAFGRLLEHYRSLTDAADGHLRALPGQPVSRRFPDATTALTWLDTERPNLTSAVPVATNGHPQIAVSLALCLSAYLHQRRLFHDALATATHALTAIRELGDRQGEGVALNNLGIALMEVRRFNEAVDAQTKAADIFRELGDRYGEGGTLSNLGLALRRVRRFEEAIDAHTKAADIHRELGDHRSEGGSLNNLGIALQEVRRFEEAIDAHTKAADICRELGDRHGEGVALNNLGIALMEVRRFEEAIDAHTKAADICRELGDRHGEGQTLGNLGNALREVRRFEEAIVAHTKAADTFRELGDHHREGQTWGNLGNAFMEVGRFEEAIDAHTKAGDICRELGDRHGEGQALNNLGIALREVRRFDEAIDAHTKDLAICRELGDRYGEGQALNNLGNALLVVRRFEEAIDAHTKDLAICHELGDRHGEGQTLGNLGVALLLVRRFEEAIDAHTKAADTFRELGDHHSKGQTLNNLGLALQEVRRFEEAIDAHTKAADIFRELGDHHSEGRSLHNLRNAQNKMHRAHGLRALWRKLTRRE